MTCSFQSADGDDAVFCVHLTWSVERDPTWPWTERYENIHEFCQRWPRQQVEGDPAVEEEDA